MPARIEGRRMWDLRHKVYQTFKVGRWVTLMRIPTLPGDSFSGRMSCFLRLHPLRRPVPFDLRVDLAGFWNPYRWTYPRYYNFLKGTTSNFISSSDAPSFTTAGSIASLMIGGAGSWQTHIREDYRRIYDHYMVDPQEVTPAVSVFDATDNDVNNFGWPAGALHNYHTTLNQTARGMGSTSDRQVDVTGTTFNDMKLDISQLPEQIEVYRQTLAEEWIGHRPEEFYRRLFGVNMPAEIEQVPHFLGMSSRWLSSHDIDGTSGDQFGAAIGKMVGGARWNLPKRMFAEHGTLTVLMAVRPHVVYAHAHHYLDNPAVFRDRNKALADRPSRMSVPHTVALDELFIDGAANTVAGWQPSLQHFRCHPNYASVQLSEVDTGWEGRPTPTTGGALAYTPNYDNVFTSTTAGHGVVVCDNDFRAARLVPEPLESIMGGVV